MTGLTDADWLPVLRAALAEDVGSGDVTTEALVGAGAVVRGRLAAREALVVSGVPVATAAFREVGPSVEVAGDVSDGDRVAAGGVILEVRGPAGAILTAERVALNFLQRLSGVATLTRRFVEAVAGTEARIRDTRKTTPGLRVLEKYAVRCGGGVNHRMGLHDQALIKDNHLAVLRRETDDPVGEAVRRVRAYRPGVQVTVEADTLDQVAAAAVAGADLVLLDNMTPGMMREAVAICRSRGVPTEASGGVDLAGVRAVAETGVDYVAIGALTHSARAVDIGLDFD